MARILWLSDAPHRPTGFGLVTREVCTRLARLGHVVRVLGWWAAPVQQPGIEVAACPVNPDGATAAIEEALTSFYPDVLVSLGDLPWVFYLAEPRLRQQLDAAGIPWYAHYPIDGALPDATMPDAWSAILRQADVAVAMSRFGQDVSAASGVAALCIPHGVDLSLFSPPADRAAEKRAQGVGERFVVLCDSRNHRRKMLPRLLDVFRGLAITRPNATLLLNINTEIDDDRDSHRYNLRADIACLGLERQVRLAKLEGELSVTALARLYAAADVHLLTSYGEGFGLPTLQAAASGVVPLAGDHSANRELLGTHGVALPADGWVLDEFGLRREFIDRGQAIAELQALHDDPALLARRAEAGRHFALAFDWDLLARRWDTLLTSAVPCSNRRRAQSASASLIALAAGSSSFGGIRPTGHHAALLPPPRLGLPLRDDAQVFATVPRVLAEAACLDALGAIAAIFPGLVLEPLPPRPDLRNVILIVDPFGRIQPEDHAGIALIGHDDALGPVATLALARKLLTDPAWRSAYLHRQGSLAAGVIARVDGDLNG